MKDSRDYILRVWSLAEDMVTQSGKPLHAFLLLHHVLTQPPSLLRRASGTTAGKPSISSSGGGASTATLPTATTSEAALSLHVTAFDAEWKCEELVTRLRAAEYILLADVPAARTAVSSTSTPAPAASSPRTLSCTAGLEALELAEQVLAPVFATTSLSVSTDAVPSAALYPQASSTASSWHQRCRASNDFAGGGDKSRGRCSASYSLDDVLREVADVSRSSASATARSSSAPLWANVDGTGSGAQSRVASMYFLNHATVTALAWPLSSFTLAWPMREARVDGADSFYGASGDGEQHLLSAPLLFGPASETITISVSLVVRAHVLQAFICHRRAQHKRALQCLAEARQWIAQQYTDAARARTVRLLWEELQERWTPSRPPPPQQQQQQQSSGTSSSPSATAISADQLPPLPGFCQLIERLIVEEGRACATMVQVEECKVHYAILQTCSSLPPPPPLPLRTSSGAVTTTFADAGAPMQAHTADLRLHYRRYQESLQFLHALSRAYMTVVRWIEEEAQGDVMTATAAAAPPPSGSVDVAEQGVAWREALRCVRSRLSPFCLCALQYTCNRATSLAPPDLATDTATTTTTADVSPCYALGFDVRLAAEVLGLYHCLSHVYLLYQQSPAASTLQPFSVKHYESLSAVELMARGGGGSRAQQQCNGSAMEERTKGKNARRGDDTFEAAKEEVAFLRLYRSDPAYVALFGDHQVRPPTRQKLSSSDAALDTDDADVLAITRDLVHRAVEHAKINAFVFGQWRFGDAAVTATLRAPSATSATVQGGKRLKTESAHSNETGGALDQCDGVQAAPLLRWRAPKDAAASTAPAIAHEAALLWCLVELGLRDNYPFVIRFQRELSDALTRVRDVTYSSGGGAANRVAAPPQLPEEATESDVGVCGSLPNRRHPAGASLPGIRKHSRSPSPSPSPSPTLLGPRASHTTTSRLQPSPSSNWVFPGVRRALQLYLELVTVLMRSAATMHATSSTPATGTEEPQSAAAFFTTATSCAAPSIPILRLGLQNAEQLMAQVLFTVDAEMLHLTGNTWGIAPGAGAREGGCTRVTGATDYRNGNVKGTSSGDVSPSHLRQHFLLADQLQCSAPAQLRGLVQIKAAVLITMARHHLTQLSLMRAVHYLREGQQFARVFHRQARLTLVPEMHVLLACLATCMSLRRLPDLPEPAVKKEGRSETRGHSVSSGDGDAATDVALDAAHDALYASAQGWISAERATSLRAGSDDGAAPYEAHSLSGHLSSHIGNGTDAAAFAVLPREESTVAQDVGLPYLHLLAAERAACTTLHTPPSLSLLLYILKAWTVFHLVTAGEELVWSGVGCNISSLPTTPLHSPTPPPPPLQQQLTRQMNGSPSISAAVPRSLALRPASPSPPFLPLPSPSHATTTLNTTVEDQQRRVARLDSLTSTPTSTPTLRSRHATLPTEMHRIQLEPVIISAATARPAVQAVKSEDTDDEGGGVGRAARGVAYGNAKEVNDDSADRKATHSPQSRGSCGVDKIGAVKSESNIGGTPAQPIYANLRGASVMAATAPCPAGAHVRALPQTQRHRAGDVLQRMMAVLLDHYETHGVYATPITAAAPSLSTEAEKTTLLRVPAAAWTPQNVVLFRLLRGAVLVCEDKDEPAAARELKEVTHLAKQHLGVLHPYVADGLALLASAYTSLDVDAVSSGDSRSHGEPSGSATSPSPQQVTGGAARTRKVALQVAMRCSCMALVSLYAPSVANGSDSVDAAGTTTAQQQQQQTAPFSTIGARLREWWGSQVIQGLCGTSSGGYNKNAVQQLRLLFGWLPGSPEYCFS